jgi:hypothetical protein
MRRLEEEEEKEVEQERLKVEKEQEQLRTRRHQLEQEVQAWSTLRNLTYRSVNRLRNRETAQDQEAPAGAGGPGLEQPQEPHLQVSQLTKE